MTEAPEMLWVWALDTFDGSPFWAGDIKTSHAEREGATEYRRADLAPKVKALVFRHRDYKNKLHNAGSNVALNRIGQFGIERNGQKFGAYFYAGGLEDDGEWIGDCDSELAAKEALNDKNAAIVLGCLEGIDQ